MKKALVKDSLKEIKNSHKRFISILLMAFLGVGFFTGMKVASQDMVDTLNQFYEENQVYDLQILSTIGMTDRDIETISQTNEIEKVVGTYEIEGKAKIENREIVTKIMCMEELNQPVLIQGELPKTREECVVEENFLLQQHKQIGDMFEVDVKNINFLEEKQLKIVGTVKSPLYISRDRGNSTLGSGKIDYYVYITRDNIKENGRYTNVYVKVKNSSQYTTASKEYHDYLEEIKQEIENPEWYVLDRDDNVGYHSFIQDSESIENIAAIFPLLFFIVALLISLTSMTRMVEEQRTQIGTLKALGYNKRQVVSKYVIYASLACIIGGMLGMSIGFVLLPKIVWMMYKMMYQMTETIFIHFHLWIGGIGLLLMSICIIGATIYAVLRELIYVPATLMRPKAPRKGKRVWLERIPFIWNYLSFSKKVTVRNLFRYKKRFLMTIIGILGCTALMVTGFGIKDSIQCVMPNQFENVFHYDMQITLKSTIQEQQKQDYMTKLQEKAEIAKVIETYVGSTIGINQEYEETIQMIIAKDQNDLEGMINLRDTQTGERVYEKENEICLTDKVAELLNVKQGDMITLKDNKEERQVKISNIVENYVSHYIYMSKETYENLYQENYQTNMLYIKYNDLNEEQEEKLATEIMNHSEVASIHRISTIMGMLDDTMKSLNYVVIILIVSAGLLAFVVLYNLANVNISERMRELATIKVLGFYDKEVYSYVTRETVILTAIGIILGLCGGYFLNYFIIGTCEINMLKFAKIVKPTSYLLATLITIVFTWIVNITTYFALKKINMIESLKSVE